MLEILEVLEECWMTKTNAAIATIIDTSGSTYRGAGVKSVILSDGTIIGTLSGGCVEEDINEHANTVIASGTPKMVEYDFYGDEDVPWGLGVGCNGALKVWIEPFLPMKQPEQTLKKLTIFKKQSSSITIISSSQPEHYPVGTTYAIDQQQTNELPSKSGLFTIEKDGAQLELYFEKLKHIPRLIIFGSGPDVVPLVRGAKLLNWLVTIVDHRPGYTNKERFPDADEFIVSPIGTFPTELIVRQNDYAVIMTHHFEQDSLFLQQMLGYSLSYLGILGPKKRTARLLHEGYVPEEGTLHSPIGLDIGAESPEEIAMSILSEIICHANNRSGNSLKLRNQPIHKKGASDDRNYHFSEWIFAKDGRAQAAFAME